MATTSNTDENDVNGSTLSAVISVEWNPNRSHHCLLAAVGKCAVIIATGTSGPNDIDLTEALLAPGALCKRDIGIPITLVINVLPITIISNFRIRENCLR